VIGAIHHCAAAVRTVMGHHRLWIEFPCPAIGTLQLVPGPRRAGRSGLNYLPARDLSLLRAEIALPNL
jgi:hypothetical protein